MIFSVSVWSACGTTVETWDTSSVSIYNHSDRVRQTADSYTIQVTSTGSLDLNVTNTYSGSKSLNAKLYSTSDCSGTPLWDINLNTSDSSSQASFAVTSGDYYLEIIANDNFTIPYDINGTFEPNEVEGTLVITKTDSVDPVDLNDTFLYYIDVTNNTEATVSNLHLTDIVPDDVTLNSFNADSNWTCATPTSNSIDCTLLFLDVNDTLRIELNVTAPAFETTLLNIAYITADNNISENATANTTVTNENIGGGGDVSLYYIDTVDEFTFSNYTTEGPILKTKIAAMPDYLFDLVHLDPSTLVPTVYRGSQIGTVAPLIVLLYLADDDCNQLTNVYLTGDDDLLARVVLQQGDSSASVVSPVLMPSLAMKKARILAKFNDLNDNNLTVGELRCVLRSSTSGNLGNLPQCFNSERRLREVFPDRGAYCLDLFNGKGPCKSNYGNPSAPYTAPYGIEPACYSCLVGGSEGECSRDNFAIRPKNFDVNITDGTIFKAEKEVSLLFRAPDFIDSDPALGSNDYNETQDVLQDGTTFTIDLNVTNNSGCPVKDLNITPIVDFRDGIHNGNFSFNDIGDINMSIHETNGTEFAIVDNDDTPIEDRLIEDFNVSFRVIPDHFNIEANLIDHNSASRFTYLHDFNRSASESASTWIKSDYTGTMTAILDVNISANGADGNITRNYIDGCYAKETDLNLTINESNITHAGSAGDAALSQFLYYNDINESEGNYSLPAPDANEVITITQLGIENNTTTFVPDAPDGNGTAHLLYRIDFDRKMNRPVNPFRLEMVDANITDEDNVTGIDTDESNATFYFARAKSSKFLYDDVTADSIPTPISIVIFNDPGTSTFGLATSLFKPTNDYQWYLSSGHTVNDGNVTLVPTDANTTITPPLANSVGLPTEPISLPGGVRSDVTVSLASGTSRPHISNIHMTGTDNWLIYNEFNNSEPIPFYRVNFVGQAGWAGHGDTGHVVDSDMSETKNNRVAW